MINVLDNNEFTQNRSVPSTEDTFCLVAAKKKTTKNGDPMLSLTFVPACDAGKRMADQEYGIVNFNTTAAYARPIDGKQTYVGLIIGCQMLYALGIPEDQLSADVHKLHSLAQTVIGECLVYNHAPSCRMDNGFVNFSNLEIDYNGLTREEFTNVLNDFEEADPSIAEDIVKDKARRNLTVQTGESTPQSESTMDASDYADV